MVLKLKGVELKTLIQNKDPKFEAFEFITRFDLHSNHCRNISNLRLLKKNKLNLETTSFKPNIMYRLIANSALQSLEFSSSYNTNA